MRSVSPKRTRTRTMLLAADLSISRDIEEGWELLASCPRLDESMVTSVQSKRRLPVLQSTAEEDPGEPHRPPWQWGVWGVLAVLLVWLPLAAIGAVARRSAPRISAGGAGAQGAALALSAVAGGFLVGRWGARGVGVREATLAGLIATVVAAALSWSFIGALEPLLWTTVAVAAIAVPMAAL